MQAKGNTMKTRKLGRGVALVGAGMSHFGAFPDKGSRDLFVDAFGDMRQSVDKGLDPADIEAIYIGNCSSDLFEGQTHLAPLLADWVGLTPRPATRVEDACASSGVALRQGILAIASGLYDIVLVGGVEKMTDLPINEVTDALATAADTAYENPAGFTFPGFYAAMASAYLHRYGATPEALMRVAQKNHDNGQYNAKAQFNASLADIMARKIASAEKKGRPVPTWANEFEFLRDDRANPLIAWPLRLFDCSPVTDGATAVLLVSEEIAGQFSDTPLHIIGSAQASDAALHDRPDLTSIGAAQHASREAYTMAGITPDDIKVAEVHDCFTIAEIIATEDIGFFAPGEGHAAAEEGLTTRFGPHPVNTSGVLKAKGHTVGATGTGQVVEIWKQMRGEAGERQVTHHDVDLALTHNVGGTGQTCAVHIFERRN
jgi:acetyl-CoA C-acetyltransferase